MRGYKHTPWGAAQHIEKEAEGIVWYSTASHGGYGLSEARLRAMPVEYARHTPFAGRGWYEEDCDWCLVWLSFPEDMRRAHGDKFERNMLEAKKMYEYYYGKKSA